MYRAPVKDISFVLQQLIGESELRKCPDYADYSTETAVAIIDEAGKFAESVLEPLCKSGDREGAKWTPSGVVTPKGFKEAYQQFSSNGWASLRASSEWGGQNSPSVIGTAVEELWAGSNLAFKLCPMLTQGAVEALEIYGSDAQRRLYLPKMVSGEWTGTMNLTEPQAGSDLAQVRTRAVPAGDHYKLFGQKIFITYGEHDYVPNIIAMVLARIDGSPPGVKGISLFIVPKFLVNADGSLGARNDVKCASIEHKLGIHASPTCVMMYGEKDGATAYLVGEANRGLEYMFVMMNAARLSVGLEGYALAERAFQQAADWSRTRVQGKPPATAAKVMGSASMGTGSSPAPIVGHPDVKRMLLTMKTQTEAMRALALYAAYQLDLGGHHADEAVRNAAQSRGDLLIPIVKGFCTEKGVEIASIGIQVHGGMGFIEETGAAQTLRDVRITTIYEGTTGIQSNDLIGRKVGRDRGAAMAALAADMERELQAIGSPHVSVQAAKRAALEGAAAMRQATESLLGALATSPDRAMAVSVPYLNLCGTALGGWMLAKSAAIAANKLASAADGRDFYEAKLRSAHFYADHVMPDALALARVVSNGATSVVETDAALI
jgi:alkylation response protein AidB-like acyl-CoA dehydrogenase